MSTNLDPTPSAPSLQSVAEGAWRELNAELNDGMTAHRAARIMLDHFAPLLAERDERIGRLEEQRAVCVQEADKYRRECGTLRTRCEELERDREHPDCHGLDTPQRVCFYEQDFYVLSNFSAFSVNVFGRDFQTSEHAYHWEKFRNTSAVTASAVRHARSAHDAFKIAEAHKGERRKDWDDVKVEVMREILRAKVEQHEYVKRKLLATGDRELVENSWRDDFWGWGPNRDGQNMLGKLWMGVRAELRAARKEGSA